MLINRIEKEWGMPRMDRRAFVVGCLAMPLAGCTGDSGGAFGPSTGSSALLPARFLNPGYMQQTGDTPVFIVTGGITP